MNRWSKAESPRVKSQGGKQIDWFRPEDESGRERKTQHVVVINKMSSGWQRQLSAAPQFENRWICY